MSDVAKLCRALSPQGKACALPVGHKGPHRGKPWEMGTWYDPESMSDDAPLCTAREEALCLSVKGRWTSHICGLREGHAEQNHICETCGYEFVN